MHPRIAQVPGIGLERCRAGLFPLHEVLEAFASTGCRHLLQCFPDTLMAPAMDHVGDCSGVATERRRQRVYAVARGIKFANAKDLLGS